MGKGLKSSQNSTSHPTTKYHQSGASMTTITTSLKDGSGILAARKEKHLEQNHRRGIEDEVPEEVENYTLGRPTYYAPGSL